MRWPVIDQPCAECGRITRRPTRFDRRALCPACQIAVPAHTVVAQAHAGRARRAMAARAAS